MSTRPLAQPLHFYEIICLVIWLRRRGQRRKEIISLLWATVSRVQAMHNGSAASAHLKYDYFQCITNYNII